MKKKILLVDDDHTLVQLLTFLLGQDYDLVTETKSVVAAERLAKESFDGLIVDMSMPELSGTQLIHMIRNEMKNIDLPIFVLSGSQNSADRVRALSLGADDFLIKPFNPEELKLRLRNFFRRFGQMKG